MVRLHFKDTTHADIGLGTGWRPFLNKDTLLEVIQSDTQAIAVVFAENLEYAEVVS